MGFGGFGSSLEVGFYSVWVVYGSMWEEFESIRKQRAPIKDPPFGGPAVLNLFSFLCASSFKKSNTAATLSDRGLIKSRFKNSLLQCFMAS